MPEGSAKLRRVGRGAGGLLFHSLCAEKKPLTWEAQVLIDFIYFWRLNKKQRSCDGQGGVRSEFKKTGARSARARTGAHARSKPTSMFMFDWSVLSSPPPPPEGNFGQLKYTFIKRIPTTVMSQITHSRQGPAGYEQNRPNRYALLLVQCFRSKSIFYVDVDPDTSYHQCCGPGSFYHQASIFSV